MTRRRTSGSYAPWLACLAGALVVADGQLAFATSCVPTPLVTVARQAAAIFEATVSSVTVHPWPEVRHPDGTVSVVAASRRSIVTLRDVSAIRGTAPESIESVERVLEPGRRYLILAMEHPLRPGVLLAGECAGYVRPSARSDGFKAWLESLGQPPTGGRILGSVVARGIGGDVAAWPAVVGARITAHGPVTVETVSGSDGQYAFTALPDGKYEVSVTLPDGRHGLLTPKPSTATLAGAHALWTRDFRAEVDGFVTGAVVDEGGRAVGGAPIFLDAQPRSSDPADLAFWIGKTDGEGRYEFRGVPPGYYVVTIDEPFAPAYARTADGAEELTVGFADRLELAPLVAMRGATVPIGGVVVDATGRPVESTIHVEILGPLGPYPRSGSMEESDAAGRFRLRLIRGRRYRFTAIDSGEARQATTEVVADGLPIRIVLP
ncbi:MAG: carboxypeptidase regulatory-like domain-containing protein [Acidobacteria bacterium]|nr:carboxypeptidase regulatory-like domain-containing protein [Acidobacteriota bacterium]